MSTITKLITYEESLTMPENKLEEIVDGESRIMPLPTEGHWKLLVCLAEILRDQLPRRDFVVDTGPVGLGIKRRPVLTYRSPDLMVFRRSVLSAGRHAKERNDPYIWVSPEILVECMSPSNRKGSIEKLLADYASIEVPEIWIFDPSRESAAVYVFEDGRLRIGETLQTGVLQSLTLPVAVDLNELWRAFAI